MCRAVRASLSFLVAAFAMMAVAVPAAHAVQASGSILLVPSKQTALVQNEVVSVEVYFRNTSTQTPGPGAGQPPIVETAATLTGPLTVDIGCVDCACTSKDPAALSFIPGPANGCDVQGTGVTGCVAGPNPGEVLINLAPAGILLPADDAPVFLATISLRNNLADLAPTVLRASTDICALTACIQPPSTGCASCAAEGCTFLAGEFAPPPLLRCKHSCLNQVNFTNNFDAYIFQGVAIVNDPNFDPSTVPFTLNMGRPNQAPVVSISVPGGIPAVGNGTWVLNGFANSNNPGIDQIKISRQTGANCQNSYRITVRFFGNFSALEGNTDELLRTTISFGALTFGNEEVWQRLQNGNLRNDIDIISAC